jgi:hypothetical protein
MHKIFVTTAKAKSESTRLSYDLKRMLSSIDGHTRSDELPKHIPPSLRPKCNDLLKNLLDGGYIAESAQDKNNQKQVPVAKAPPDFGERTSRFKLSVITAAQEQVQPNGHGNSATPKNETRDARFPHLNHLPQAGEEANESLREFRVNQQQSSSPKPKIESNLVAKAEADSTQLVQKAVQISKKQVAPSIAAQVKADVDTSTELKAAIEKHAKDARIIHDLEITNLSLMELLTQAYMQIEVFKATHGKN